MMKKVISMLLICAMLLTAGAALAEAPGNQLGFDVLRALTDGTKNQVFSPVSLAYALGMALEGADGATEDEIEKALGTDDLDDWIEYNGSKLTTAGLKLANAAFITGEIQPDADYIEDLKKDFGAEWFEMSGDMADKINQWTKEHTDGLIEKLIDGELDPLSQLVLVNAVAMDAKWSSPFSADETADGIFHAPDGDVTASMMHQTLYADYAETDEAQILRLTYSDSGLSMLLALPKDGQSVTCKRMLEDGYMMIKAPVPCLLTCVKELNEPRYMSVNGIVDCYSKPLTILDFNALKDDPLIEVIDPTTIGLKGSPTNIFKSFTPPQKGVGIMLEGADKATCEKLAGMLAEKHII